jgi:hypothetical protein
MCKILAISKYTKNNFYFMNKSITLGENYINNVLGKNLLLNYIKEQSYSVFGD